MRLWSYSPIWVVDLIGSILMIVMSSFCLLTAYKIYKRDSDNALVNHILWFCLAIFAFSVSRSIGHILRHIIFFAGYGHLWKHLAPVSGSINSITFVVIASVTLFFHRMQYIMVRMDKDRRKIEQTNQELIILNKDTEALVAERTMIEMALRVAHEIRNPVMIIGAMLRRIVSGVPECDAQKENLTRVIEQADKLEQLVQRFEDFRPEMEKVISTLDLNELLHEAVEILQQETSDKKINLTFSASPSPAIFQGNRQLIKIAVLHVLRNALEVCKSGDSIHIANAVSEKGVRLEITDTGPGIRKEILEHVFEPFYTTNVGRTGLGLAFVQQVISEHKGKVEITSTVGKGTTVIISLPSHLWELLTA